MKCSKCDLEVEECVFATYKKVIDGKEYVFCCAKCAERVQASTK